MANHLAFSALGAPENHAAWHELTRAVLRLVASRSALADAMIVCKIVFQAPLYVRAAELGGYPLIRVHDAHAASAKKCLFL